jgi:hypothetical protein
LMQLHFTCTIDDFVDLAIRSNRQSGKYKFVRWQAAFLASLLMGIIAFIFLNDGIYWRLIRSSLLFSGSLVGYSLWYKWIYTSSIRGALEARFGKKNNIDIQVTLDHNGLLFKQSDTITQYSWKQILRAVAINDSVEIWTKTGLVAIIRGNAFQDENIRQQFISEVNKYANTLAPNGA